MKAPVFSSLSLAILVAAAGYGYYIVRTAKSATNMGEALGPYFAFGILLAVGAGIGEVSAAASFVRGERPVWLSWLGFAANGGALLWIFLLLRK